MSLVNKTVIISGASRGIGKATAELLASLGMNVVLIARSEADLKKLEQEITQKGGKALALVASVNSDEDVQNIVNQTLQTFGSVDVLINNAGIGLFKHVEEISSEDWDIVMNVNVKGTFLLTKAVLPYMKQHHKGTIINIASDVSKRTFPSGSLYCASKYAQEAFASALRKEVRPFHIKVSTIYPGLTDTYFHSSPKGEDRKKDWLKSEDIAQAILYILQAPHHVLIDELMIHPLNQEY